MNRNVFNYIRALTSFGGGKYKEYAEYYTEENEKEYKEWLNEQPKVSGITLYRGYTFSRGYYNDCFEYGQDMITVDGFTQDFNPSFTSSELRAARYINDFGDFTDSSVRVLFQIHTNGKYFVSIKEYSVYPEEDEYKCLDTAELKIISIEKKGGFTLITVSE